MRSTTVYFEDNEWERLMESKGNLTWRDFILQIVRNQEEAKKILKNALGESMKKAKKPSPNSNDKERE